MREYSLYIFDLDGTLYQECGRQFRETALFEKIKSNSISFLENRLNLTPETAESVWSRLLAQYGIDVHLGLEKEAGISKGEYFNYVWDIDTSEYMSNDSKLQDLLRGITKKKAMLTGSPRVWANNAMKQLGVAEVFDGVWTRDEKYVKPQKEAYLQVTDYFKVLPENTIFIDNELRYLLPARELGMLTIFVSDKPNTEYPTIPSIYNLPMLLEGVGV